MEFLKISALILVTVIMVSSLPLFDKSLSVLVTLSAGVIIAFYVLTRLEPAIHEIKSILEKVLGSDLSLIFKTVGISLVTQFVCDISLDSGNKTLANQMIFTGKTAIMMVALPLFMKVMELIGNLLE